MNFSELGLFEWGPDIRSTGSQAGLIQVGQIGHPERAMGGLGGACQSRRRWGARREKGGIHGDVLGLINRDELGPA
jgi:hypothetical protein